MNNSEREVLIAEIERLTKMVSEVNVLLGAMVSLADGATDDAVRPSLATIVAKLHSDFVRMGVYRNSK